MPSKKPIRLKVIAATLGALVASVVGSVWVIDPEIGSALDEILAALIAAAGAFAAGYAKRERGE